MVVVTRWGDPKYECDGMGVGKGGGVLRGVGAGGGGAVEER